MSRLDITGNAPPRDLHVVVWPCCHSWATFSSRGGGEEALAAMRASNPELWADAELIAVDRRRPPGRLAGGTLCRRDDGTELTSWRDCPAHRKEMVPRG